MAAVSSVKNRHLSSHGLALKGLKTIVKFKYAQWLHRQHKRSTWWDFRGESDLWLYVLHLMLHCSIFRLWTSINSSSTFYIFKTDGYLFCLKVQNDNVKILRRSFVFPTKQSLTFVQSIHILLVTWIGFLFLANHAF